VLTVYNCNIALSATDLCKYNYVFHDSPD